MTAIRMTAAQVSALTRKVPVRAPRKPRMPSPTEDAEQESLFAYLQARRGTYPALNGFYMIPNGGKLAAQYVPGKDGGVRRFSTEGEKLKRMGLRPGFPDMGLAYPSGGFHGLFIELKRVDDVPSRTKPQLRQLQKEWADWLRLSGYMVRQCKGWRAAWNVVVEYLGLPERERVEETK